MSDDDDATTSASGEDAELAALQARLAARGRTIAWVSALGQLLFLLMVGARLVYWIARTFGD